MSEIDRDKQEAGVKTLNQAFKRYEQVEKSQAYILSENEDQEEFDDEFQIKTCDLTKWLHGTDTEKNEFVQDLGEAFEEIGFAILENHGQDLSFYRKMEDHCAEFFETIRKDERQPYLAKRFGSVNQGYFPVNETSIIHPDLVEGWVFCRRAFDLDNDPSFNAKDFWPDAKFEEKFRPLVIEHQKLVLPIMQACLTYLGCDKHLYDEKLTNSNFGFRLNYFPALKGGLEGLTGGRMLGHEDVDFFTLLPASSQPGLQVLNRKNMKWVRINPPEGTMIINTGDYMQRITNDRFPSTTHRVAQPPGEVSKKQVRISLPMAVYVWENEILEVLPGLGEAKYPPIPAEEFHTKITSKYYGDDYRET
ncbi:MAG: 2OG-Fe(II) oxygenase family protein [Sphingomonadales bacterium]